MSGHNAGETIINGVLKNWNGVISTTRDITSAIKSVERIAEGDVGGFLNDLIGLDIFPAAGRPDPLDLIQEQLDELMALGNETRDLIGKSINMQAQLALNPILSEADTVNDYIRQFRNDELSEIDAGHAETAMLAAVNGMLRYPLDPEVGLDYKDVGIGGVIYVAATYISYINTIGGRNYASESRKENIEGLIDYIIDSMETLRPLFQPVGVEREVHTDPETGVQLGLTITWGGRVYESFGDRGEAAELAFRADVRDWQVEQRQEWDSAFLDIAEQLESVSTGTDQFGNRDHEVLRGTQGNDYIRGNDGDDRLLGLGGEDALHGQNGNDRLEGGGGDDYLVGGIGDDLLFGGTGVNVLEGGDGIDTVDYWGTLANRDLPLGVTVSLLETRLQDTGHTGDVLRGIENLLGTSRGDVFTGAHDDNYLDGRGGNDTLLGNDGEDTLTGGEGFDILYGGEDNDHLNGGEDNDHLDGGNGNDRLEGGLGRDTLEGGNGDDVLIGHGAFDRLDGGAGNDVIQGSGFGSFLIGGGGNDRFVFRDGAEAYGGTLTEEIRGFDAAGAAAGDIIDLRGIDADRSVAGDQAFVFAETPGGPGTIAEVELFDADTEFANPWTVLVGSVVDVDGTIDEFRIEIVNGTPAALLTADDFLL